MLEFYSLRKLLDEGSDISSIIDEILFVTVSAKRTYPEYASWFLTKHVPGIYDGTRNTIIAIYKKKIVGVANIKSSENKLCTLYFAPKFRRQGLGIKMVKESLEYLNTSKPLITMPSSYIHDFKKIITRYNWQLTDCIDDCYTKNVSEFVFNGEIARPNQDLSNEERIILTYKHTKDKNILKLLKNPFVSRIKLSFLQKKSKNSKKVLSN